MVTKFQRELIAKSILGIIGFIVSLISFLVVSRDNELRARMDKTEQRVRDIEIPLAVLESHARSTLGNIAQIENTLRSHAERFAQINRANLRDENK